MCQSGANSGWHCGEVVDTDYDNIPFYQNTFVATYSRAGGDSGAPVVGKGDYRAIGVHKGGKTNGDAIFTHASFLDSYILVTPCRSNDGEPDC